MLTNVINSFSHLYELFFSVLNIVTLRVSILLHLSFSHMACGLCNSSWLMLSLLCIFLHITRISLFCTRDNTGKFQTTLYMFCIFLWEEASSVGAQELDWVGCIQNPCYQPPFTVSVLETTWLQGPFIVLNYWEHNRAFIFIH